MRLIDADKLIDSFYKFFKSYEGQWEEDQPQYWADNMAVVVDDAPTVEAEPIRHGQWIRTEAYPHRVVCSECHKTYVRNENIIEGRYKGDEIVPIYCTEAEYCPHCGAKMDEIDDVTKSVR